jgi:hypothetical protein
MKRLEKIRLKDMMNDPVLYSGLPDGLVQFIIPERIKIGWRSYSVPQTVAEFTSNICYGQRMFFTRKEDNDFGIILRTIDGYFYPFVSGKKWDQDKALLFGKNVIHCKVSELYPVSNHLVKLIGEMADREQQLLHRNPSKLELAAGIEKLNVFTELSALDFLRDAMKVPVAEVLLTPYNECLVRFMLAKETAEYQERVYELIKEDSKSKVKKYG